MASTGSQNICYRSLSIPLLEYAFSHQSHAHYMNLGESHISCPVGFSALKGVSLAPSSRTQCWAGGKVGKHRKDALGVKAGPEDRAEPRDAAPTLYHLMPFSLQGNWSLSLPPRMTNCPYLPGLRGFLKHRTFDAKTRTVFFTTQRVGVHRGLPLGPWLLHA